MKKHLIVTAIATFTALAAYAAPARNVEVPQAPTHTDEIAGNVSTEDKGSVSNLTNPLDEKVQGLSQSKKSQKSKK
jgi:hypothetical protein